MSKKGKKAKGSKKGSPFERKICKELSLWWSGGNRTDIFWRTPTSGGMATTRGKKGEHTRGMYGDIMATDPSGEPFLKAFCVELKKGYSDESILDLFDRNNSSSYRKWLKKLEETRKTSEALSIMLIHQRDRRNAMVFISLMAFNMLGLGAQHTIWIYCKSLPPLAGMSLKSFLSFVSPQNIKDAVECWKQSSS